MHTTAMETAPQTKLEPFHFVTRSEVPWWKAGNKDFQSDIVPQAYREPPTGVVTYREPAPAKEPKKK
jgi:hypothetical protein